MDTGVGKTVLLACMCMASCHGTIELVAFNWGLSGRKSSQMPGELHVKTRSSGLWLPFCKFAMPSGKNMDKVLKSVYEALNFHPVGNRNQFPKTTKSCYKNMNPQGSALKTPRSPFQYQLSLECILRSNPLLYTATGVERVKVIGDPLNVAHSVNGSFPICSEVVVALVVALTGKVTGIVAEQAFPVAVRVKSVI